MLALRGLTWHGTIKKLSAAGMAMPCPFGRGFAGIAYGKAHGTNKKRSSLNCSMIIHMWPMKLKKYQVDLPARIFKKFARGETELSLVCLKKCFGATSNFTYFLTKPRTVGNPKQGL